MQAGALAFRDGPRREPPARGPRPRSRDRPTTRSTSSAACSGVLREDDPSTDDRATAADVRRHRRRWSSEARDARPRHRLGRPRERDVPVPPVTAARSTGSSRRASPTPASTRPARRWRSGLEGRRERRHHRADPQPARLPAERRARRGPGAGRPARAHRAAGRPAATTRTEGSSVRAARLDTVDRMIRVRLLVDDDPLVRSALTLMLGGQSDIEVVGRGRRRRGRPGPGRRAPARRRADGHPDAGDGRPGGHPASCTPTDPARRGRAHDVRRRRPRRRRGRGGRRRLPAQGHPARRDRRSRPHGGGR